MGTLASGMSPARTCLVCWGAEAALVHAGVLERPRTPTTRPPATAAHAHGPWPGMARARREQDEAEPRRRKGHFQVRQAQTGPADVGRGEQAQWLGSGPTHVLCSPPRLCILGVQGPQRKGAGWSPGIIPERLNATVLASSLDRYWVALPHPPQRPGSRTVEATRDPEGELGAHVIIVPRTCTMRAHALTGKRGEAGGIL